MKTRKLRIINFLYLDDKKYKQIREYRNQKYIREVSLNQNKITVEEHQSYKILLNQQDIYFAYLILCDERDYGVITFKKIDNNTCYIGDYLVKEKYKYEGGGIVNRFCINYLCNKINIKYIRAKQFLNNTRGNRGGGVFTIEHISSNNGYNEYLSEVPKFYEEKNLATKARKMFDKIYKITEIIL